MNALAREPSPEDLFKVSSLFKNMCHDFVNQLDAKLNKRHTRPYVQTVVEKVLPRRGLYDTGADLTCMNTKTFRKIPVDKRPKKVMGNNRSAQSAGGDRLEALGTYNMTLTLEGRTMTHPVVVMSQLNEDLILGMDFIEKHQLFYDFVGKKYHWDRPIEWIRGYLKLRKEVKLSALSATQVPVQIVTESGMISGPAFNVIASIGHHENPLLTGGPYLIKGDSCGHANVLLYNCSPVDVTLPRGDFVGLTENVKDCEYVEVNPAYINAISEQMDASKKTPITKEKRQMILEKFCSEVDDEWKSRYLQVLLDNHEAISTSKFDLGRATTMLHDIELKTKEPIFVKQFKIPDAHQDEVENHVKEWIKLGVVEAARSKYNSPIFAVMKKTGGVRLVQDFRALNKQTFVDKYSMHDIEGCMGQIGRSGSHIFSTLDLTAGFWQMLLDPKCRPYTAFTVPGMGQYQWVTSPMGLLGCPASFQRLMESVVKGIDNVLVYIDDLLVHSDSHERQLDILEQLFQRLVQHGIKVNLDKCVFGNKNVSYLGFRLTDKGILPGMDKLKAIRDVPPPADVHQVRQFVGLCNFFRNHVKNFALIAAPLNKLLTKQSEWKSGPLPADALKSFQELKAILLSEPVMSYPRRNRPYCLLTDAACGDSDQKRPGGLGAILTQTDEKGEHHVIAYASRGLQQAEKNYSPFLLEMQASVWGMNHFDTYLRGRHFTLFTDHRPLEKLGAVHTKTLNRLQEAMLEFDFETVYKKGSEMPADFLSRNVVNAISFSNKDLKEGQQQDPKLVALYDYLMTGRIPDQHSDLYSFVKLYERDSFVEDGLLWRRLRRPGEADRVVIYAPPDMRTAILEQAHGAALAGHDGQLKTKERVLQTYFWPGLDGDVQQHVKTCHKCQLRRTDHPQPPPLLSPLPIVNEPNIRIHADLFGPLRTSNRGKKYLLCMTDACTKYVELVALDNKEAATVAEAIFTRWICRYGVPIDIVTDKGREFCAELTESLLKKLGSSHFKTAPYHPQTNSQAEVANKTIAKYLASVVDDSTLDWEDYVFPLMFSYNTSFHRSVLNTPHMLNFGVQARQPAFIPADLDTKFYGPKTAEEKLARLQYCRQLASQNLEVAAEAAKAQHDATAQPHQYKVKQWVLIRDHTPPVGKNAKLTPRFRGPYQIIRLKGPHNLEIKLNDQRTLTRVVNVAECKPYFERQMQRPDYDESRFQTESRESGLPPTPEIEQTDEERMPPPPPPPTAPTPATYRTPAHSPYQPTPKPTPKTPFTPSSAHLPPPSPSLPPTPKYSHGFEFNFPAIRSPQHQTSFRRGEGYAENQNQTPSTASTPNQPSTSASSYARPQRTRELPARLRDPDQLVELPGQAIPPELAEAINVIKKDLEEGWIINSPRKVIRRRARAISAIVDYSELIKTINYYRKHNEPEPKWTTQEWCNFILTGNKLFATPPYDYREVEIDLTPPAQAAVVDLPANDQPAQPAQPAQPVQPPPAAPAPPVPAALNQDVNAAAGPAIIVADLPMPTQQGQATPPQAPSPSHSGPVSRTSSTDTAGRGSTTTLTGSEYGTPRSSASPSPPPGPSRAASTPATASPATAPGPSRTLSRPDSVRHPPDLVFGMPAPVVQLATSMVSARDSLVRNTRRRLADAGLIMPESIVHDYLPTRQSKKK